MDTNRSTLEIYRDILDAAWKNRDLHSWRLAGIANLNSGTMSYFVNDLLWFRLLEVNGNIYHTTEKGLVVKNKITSLLKLVDV